MLPQRRRIETAVQLALQGATVLTSNTRAARRLQLECALRRDPDEAWRTPDILPFAAWIERTWTECLLTGNADRSLLSTVQLRAVWERIIVSSPYGRTLLNNAGAASSAMAASQLVHDYRLPVTWAAYSPTEESRAFFEWTQHFDSICRRELWTDFSTAATRILALSSQLPERPAKLVVFGFDRFTPLQLELWKALGQAGTELTLLAPEMDSPRGAVQALSLSDAELELRAAAQWARSRLERNAETKIGIVAPDLGARRVKAERIFEEVLHPERLVLSGSHGQRSFDISLGIPLGDYAIVRCALRILKLAISALDASELSALLRCPYLGGFASEDCDRARLDMEIRRKRKREITTAALDEAINAGKPSVPALQRALRLVQREAERIPASLTRSQWTYHVRRLLNDAGWPGDGGGGRKRDATEFQATEAWQRLLQDFAALDVVEPPGTPGALLRELERLATDRTFAPENELAPVQILGTLEAAGDSFDALWLCGLSDEQWPPRVHPNPCLPIALQQQAGIPDASPVASVHQASLITSRILQSAGECVLSWPEREDDRELRSSPLLSGFPRKTLSQLGIELGRRWSAFAPAPSVEESVDEMAPPAEGGDLRTRGTKLIEWQSNCPFQSFASNRLGAEPPDSPSLGLDPRDRGKLIELMLQKVWESLRTSTQLAQPGLTDQEIDRVVAQAADSTIEELYPPPGESWETRYRLLERERLVRLTREWLELEKKREPFEVVGHQEGFDVEIGGLRIRGQIDRIDRTLRGDYVVIDYKSGRGPYSVRQWSTPRPSRPQLPLYAVSQMEHGHEIAGVAYAQVRTGQCSFKGDARDRGVFGSNGNSAKEFQQRISAWKPELEKIAAEFLAGHAEVDPKEPPGSGNSPCWNCRLAELCRVAEMRLSEPATEADDDE